MLISRGYDPNKESEMDSDKEHELFELFSQNVGLLRSRKKDILRSGDYFFCAFPFASCSWPYLSGDWKLYLGYLLIGWDNGELIEECPDCKAELLVYSFAGSILSWTNSYSGICSETGEKHRGSSAGSDFIKRTNFVSAVRKLMPFTVAEKVKYEGQKFTWGGTGLEPAQKEKTVEHALAEPVDLETLLEELNSNIVRRTNPLKVSELPGEFKLKLE